MNANRVQQEIAARNELATTAVTALMRRRPLLPALPFLLPCSVGAPNVALIATALPAATAAQASFSADTAYVLLRKQVEFGPRVPGTPGHAAQLEWMTDFLRARADTVVHQPFVHRGANQKTVQMTNVFARFRPEADRRILLLAHWDTRPTADMEDEEERRSQPIPGANDGASGTAVLLELANVLSRHSPPIGVDLLFVDGEDYGRDEQGMYLGAKHFAANLPRAYSPMYGILLDMVGDRNPIFRIEGNSQELAPEVVQRVWRLAEELGYSGTFRGESDVYVTDDHLPLNRAGIRTIDIIDFEFGPGNRYWHTLEDDLNQTSPKGLGIVGTVLVSLIYRGG